MSKRIGRAGVAVLCLLLALPAGAAEPMIYPAKGQNPEQTKKDKGECYAWAIDETGFDSANTEAPSKTVTTALPEEKVVGSGAMVRGAAGFDGSQDLLCAPTDIAECDQAANCDRVSASEVGLPHFLKLQFGKKRLVSLGSEERSTPIEIVRNVQGLTILQGAENGRAWSLVVEQATGRLSGSVTDGDGAFAVFGACTIP